MEGKGIDQMDEKARAQEDFTMFVEDVRMLVHNHGGRWTSSAVRFFDDGSPPTAAMHLVLNGKRYLGILQPLDMLDQSERK